jgi:hypothetical protein
MTQTLTIPSVMPGLNELLDLKARSGRRGRRGARFDRYAEAKASWGRSIALFARQQGLRPVTSARFRFVWTEETNRRDPDNIAAGGRKLILDGLVSAGILPNDGRRQVLGWEDHFITDRAQAGVLVEIISDEEYNYHHDP